MPSKPLSLQYASLPHFANQTIELISATELSEYQFILVEDSEADIFMTSEHFEDLGLLHCLTIIRDPMHTLPYLKEYCTDHDDQIMRPPIILLDLHMPCINGTEILERIREETHFQNLPVILLTCNELEQIHLRSMDVATPYFLKKPLYFHDLQQLVRQIKKEDRA